MRWPALIFGIYFNADCLYSPTTGENACHFTLVPLLAGLLVFCIGQAVGSYEKALRMAYDSRDKDEEIWTQPTR